eukprot:TRINITY_DN3901_c0_g1_i1.p1 TRINITY_DN3901_c0_g1~~TRINITY_DN3901_c0_g1_i1.p1  ORF type:complete len:550 (-),score=52.38 TRINITY_DN3901_c0_g1_i1:80-1687(-)
MVLPQCRLLRLLSIIVYSCARISASAKLPTLSVTAQGNTASSTPIQELFQAWDAAFETVRKLDKQIVRIPICQPRRKPRNSGAIDVNSYSLLEYVHRETKRKAVDAAKHDSVLDRFMGSLTGMAVADALGAPLEFIPARNSVGNSNYKMHHGYTNEKNAFRLQAGQWTDDSSMGLCTADSLLISKGFDGSDLRTRFYCWWWAGYDNAFRKDEWRQDRNSVGLGGNIAKSLPIDLKSPPAPEYTSTSEDSGNGSIMRLAAVALFFFAHDRKGGQLYDYARKSSKTTHPGAIAAEACAALAHLIVRALEQPRGRVDARTFLDRATAEYVKKLSEGPDPEGKGIKEIRALLSSKPWEYKGFGEKESLWNWKSENTPLIEETLKARGKTYNNYPVSAGYLGSYAIDGLAMALWAVYHTTSFNDAVVRSVNMLGDADSHGSVTGQLAGALYGYSQIDGDFIEAMHKWAGYDIPVRALLLYKEGRKAALEGENASGSLLQVENQGAKGLEVASDMNSGQAESIRGAHEHTDDLSQSDGQCV